MFISCSACGKPIDQDEAEHCARCGGPICQTCWEANRTCADVEACSNRQVKEPRVLKA